MSDDTDIEPDAESVETDDTDPNLWVSSSSVYHTDAINRLTAEERERYSHHNLGAGWLPPSVAFLLHLLTLGAFTVVYFGRQHGRLPRIEAGDWSARRAIAPMFIPFLQIVWTMPFWVNLTVRLQFQYRIRYRRVPEYLDQSLTLLVVLLIWALTLVGPEGALWILIFDPWDIQANRLLVAVGFSYVIAWFFVGLIGAYFQAVIRSLEDSNL